MRISALETHMQMLSLLDANYRHRYLCMVPEPGTCIRGHGWIFLFQLKSHMHLSYTGTCKLHTGQYVTQSREANVALQVVMPIMSLATRCLLPTRVSLACMFLDSTVEEMC